MSLLMTVVLIAGLALSDHSQAGFLRQPPEHQLWTYLAWSPFLEHQHGSYGLIPHGVPGTIDFRLYFRDAFGPISPFHDIPLHADVDNNVFHMIVEIPRWTNAKLEISNEEVLNPIRQNAKNGKLRFTANLFPHHGYMWNYGAFPQTWENPFVNDDVTGLPGDNDPLDILEIGTRVAQVGEVVMIKVIGALGLIDQGETDWKILAIDVKDELASKINDICDIEKQFPGLLQATHDWLRDYKRPDGKLINSFAKNGKVQNKDFALGVLNRTHEHWKRLLMDPTLKAVHSRLSVTQTDSPFNLPRTAVMGFTVSSVAPKGLLDIEKPGGDSWYFLREEGKAFGRNCSAEAEN